MASSSRPCSDEELQKARDDLRQLQGRNPIPKGFSPPNNGEQQGKNEEDSKCSKNGEKKKKMIRLPPELAEALINYRCMPFPEQQELPAHAQENYKELGDDLRTAHWVAEVLAKQCDENIRILQDKMQLGVETKGYFTYEASDEEDDFASAVAALQQGARGGGRSKHRPGVMKGAGGVTKLI